MAGKTLDLEHILKIDNLAFEITNRYTQWNMLRQNKISEWNELRKYVFAIDTTTTENKDLPWKNKTTLPKLCQIRDNLYANYVKSLFPKRNWIKWEAFEKSSNTKTLRKNIENYMMTIIERSKFVETVAKLLLDWIDYGNCFATLEWVDHRIETDTHNQVGYIGPRAVRVSPLDIVFNPLSDQFEDSPKIVKSLLSLGELKEYLERLSSDGNREEYEELFEYLKEVRRNVQGFDGDVVHKDQLFNVDGFTSFQAYLESGMVEVLMMFGDIYDIENDKFYRNHIAIVADRHKLISIKPNPSFFGKPSIFHSGWRIRQDNLWAMGPLDNLVGLQYRIDHLENLKADVFDLVTFPPLKIKGYVDDFNWGPFEKIFVGDEGDVEVLSPDVNALNVNLEINLLEQKMEEMAGAPKEALGFRTPGEKTKYEVQRLENAASRIFQSKLEMFENQIIEPLVNAMFEMCVRLMPPIDVGVYNEELNITSFKRLGINDITGNGRIRPIAAKHFAEKAEKIQNTTAFLNSAAGQDEGIRMHLSDTKLAAMFEELLELEGYELFTPFIRLSEQAQAQRIANSQMEETMMETQTPTGLTPDDTSAGIRPPQA